MKIINLTESVQYYADKSFLQQEEPAISFLIGLMESEPDNIESEPVLDGFERVTRKEWMLVSGAKLIIQIEYVNEPESNEWAAELNREIIIKDGE